MYLILLLLAVIAFFVLRSYNSMRHHMENLKESLSNISVVTSKKVSLINQLIDIVKNYAESEKFVMLKVSSDTVQGVQQATSLSGTVIADIGRTAQRFPELKSNQQYNMLMDALQRTEQEVQNARTAYNHNAKVYNTARTSIPTVFYASPLGFGEAQYLSISTTEDPEMRVQKSMISDDSERLNELLGKAGRKAMDSAKALAEKGVTAVQQKTQTVQEGLVCPSCGSSAATATTFCGDCGARLAPAVQSN